MPKKCTTYRLLYEMASFLNDFAVRPCMGAKSVSLKTGAKSVSLIKGAESVSLSMGAKIVSIKWVPKVCH